MIEKNLRNVLDNMLEGFQIIDHDWRYIYVNDAAAEHGRSEKKDLIGKTMMEMYPGIEKKEMFSVLSRCMKERVQACIENEFTYHNGEKRWFDLSIQPIPEGILILSIDITQSKKVEKELRESEEKYRTLTDNISIGIYRSTGLEGKFLAVNPALIEMLGYPNENEILATKFTDYYQNKIDSKKFMEKMSEDGCVMNRELQLKKKDGTPFWASVTAIAVPDEKGEIPYYDGTIEDITKKKKAEEALREEKEKFETYLNLARVLMIAIDAEGIVTYVNKKGCKVLGYEENEIVGKDWFTNFLPERNAKKTKKYAKKLLSGQMKPEEYNENPVVTKSGEERIIAWHNILLKNEKGKPIGTLSSGKDITEWKKTKQEMRELSYRLNGISPGECYISESEKRLMNVFAYSVVYGRSGLCITRKNPEILIKKCSIKPENIRLLSSSPIKGFQILGNLQEVSLEISNFLKDDGNIVLLDGLEYLVSRFGFNSVYSMLQEKRFDFLAANAVLLIPVNFEALTIQERALLASEFKTIE